MEDQDYNPKEDDDKLEGEECESEEVKDNPEDDDDTAGGPLEGLPWETIPISNVMCGLRSALSEGPLESPHRGPLEGPTGETMRELQSTLSGGPADPPRGQS